MSKTQTFDEEDKLRIERMRQIVREQEETHLLMTEILTGLKQSGVEIVPYRRNVEMAVRVQERLSEVSSGSFLRIYVPNGRYQSEQLYSFLAVLQNYVQTVESQPFTIDSYQSQHGMTYVFKSSSTVNLASFSDTVARFDVFMKMCQDESDKATSLLEKIGSSPGIANQLVTKYAKRYQRLQIDIKHEVESKTLALRQQLESEWFELSSGIVELSNSALLPSSLVLMPNNTGPITINLPPNTLPQNSLVEEIAERVLAGDITYTEEDRQILTLLREHTEGLEAISLKSDLEQLKDESIPEQTRLTAKQKVAGFLHRISPVVGESVVKGTLEYLTKIMIGG